MADYGIFEYSYDGLSAEPSHQWERYETLLEISSDSELLFLCNNRSPVIRAYAFQGLIRRQNPKIFDILTTHIHDTAAFDRSMGCMVGPCYVSDFYLELVGYFPYNSITSYKISPQERNLLDSLMLFGQEITLRRTNYNEIRLNSRKYLLANLVIKEAYYNRLREILLAGVIEALPALAKFKKKEDIPLFKKIYEEEGRIAHDFVFDAIINFPHPDLFVIVEKEVTNDLVADNSFDGSSDKFYQAAIKYKIPKSKELLAEAISKNENENQKWRAKRVREFIADDSGEMFKDLLNPLH